MTTAPRQPELAPIRPTADEATRRHAFLSARVPSGRTFRDVFEACGVGFDRYGRPVTRTVNSRR